MTRASLSRSVKNHSITRLTGRGLAFEGGRTAVDGVSRRRFRWIQPVFVAALLSLAPGLVSAGGTHCDTYVPSCEGGLCDCGECDSGCDSASGCQKCFQAHHRNHNPLYRSLDALAGGIEHVLGLDRCKSRCGCDAACDAAPWDGNTPILLTPSTALPTPPPHMPAPLAVPHAGPTPAMPPVDALPSTPEAPSETTPQDNNSSPNMTKPRIVPSVPPAVEKTSPNDATDIPSLELPNDDPATEPKKDGSIFDALEDVNDPFSEDAARLRQPYQPVQPTSLRSAQRSLSRRVPGRDAAQAIGSGLHRAGPQHPTFRSVHPARQHPAQMQTVPARQNQAVGSGLRRAESVEPLKRVNHEETVPLSRPLTRTMQSGRVLAPYRASR